MNKKVPRSLRKNSKKTVIIVVTEDADTTDIVTDTIEDAIEDATDTFLKMVLIFLN